jgi:hypothetical protein
MGNREFKKRLFDTIYTCQLASFVWEEYCKEERTDVGFIIGFFDVKELGKTEKRKNDWGQ